MTKQTLKPSLFRQFWQALLGASEVLVAIQYAAPWAPPAPKAARRAAREISPSMISMAA